MQIITQWARWLDATVGTDPLNQVSAKIGRSPSTVGRWTRTGSVPAEGAIAIARAYGGDPVAALIASGWITLQDMQDGMRAVVAAAPAVYLTEELHQRAVAAEARRRSGPTQE